MYSGVLTDCARSLMVIPAHAGIQTTPGAWIQAYAGMTLPLCSIPMAERSTGITH